MLLWGPQLTKYSLLTAHDFLTLFGGLQGVLFFMYGSLLIIGYRNDRRILSEVVQELKAETKFESLGKQFSKSEV
jgi:hypothetical protein